jgi:hypothetical protein
MIFSKEGTFGMDCNVKKAFAFMFLLLLSSTAYSQGDSSSFSNKRFEQKAGAGQRSRDDVREYDNDSDSDFEITSDGKPFDNVLRVLESKSDKMFGSEFDDLFSDAYNDAGLRLGSDNSLRSDRRDNKDSMLSKAADVYSDGTDVLGRFASGITKAAIENPEATVVGVGLVNLFMMVMVGKLYFDKRSLNNRVAVLENLPSGLNEETFSKPSAPPVTPGEPEEDAAATGGNKKKEGTKGGLLGAVIGLFSSGKGKNNPA